MAQYLAERPFPLVGHTDRPWNEWPSYYTDSVYHSHHNSWQNSPQSSAPQTNVFPSLYPESSQRTILTASPDNIETMYDHPRSHSSSTLWDPNAPSVDEFQYPDLEMQAEDTEAESRQTSPPASVSVAPSLLPSVKVEPEDSDGCFIMELSSMSPTFGLSLSGMNQALAPPTEVPLRATQASKEMRKMMGVFRLNPFAMHTGEGRGVMPAPWCGGGPLEEEPLIFEFQLDIEDDPGDIQFDHVGMPSRTSGSPTESLGAEEEAQLRSFSPSFELHPEDLRSEMGEEHEQEPEDYAEPDQQNEWSDADYGNQSEVDTSSTTHSVHTPSETRSAHTPFNESSVFQYPTPPSAASTWDIDSYQPHGEEHLPHTEKMEGGHKMHRVHTATSHPYLRKSHLNHQASPSSSTHSLSQSHTHLHPRPELNYGYPVLQQPTHHQHQHYSQIPSQSHSQSYSQLPTFHESIVSAPLSNLELIPVSSHRLEESTMSSSYMRSSRTLKLAEDETSTLHHHRPAGIVNEYTPRGTASSTYTGQHDTHAGSHHQYEMIQHSSSSHVLSPSRRWSLPETIGGPFRGTM